MYVHGLQSLFDAVSSWFGRIGVQKSGETARSHSFSLSFVSELVQKSGETARSHSVFIIIHLAGRPLALTFYMTFESAHFCLSRGDRSLHFWTLSVSLSLSVVYLRAAGVLFFIIYILKLSLRTCARQACLPSRRTRRCSRTRCAASSVRLGERSRRMWTRRRTS